MGGLARKAAYVKDLTAGRYPVLVVDGGDLFFSEPRLDEEQLAAEKIKARTILEGYNRIGTDAITVGEYDLAAGLPFLKALADSAHFPFLSVSLADAAGDLVFAPYTILEKDSLKVGLIGASSQMPAGDGYRWRELLPALDERVWDVYAQTDLLILLFHGTDRDKQAILDSGLPIDLILQSHVGRYDSYFGSGPVPVSAMGSLGRYLNVITVNISSPGQPLVDVGNHTRTLELVELTLERLSEREPEGASLEEQYADEPGVLNRIREMRELEADARESIETALNTVSSERVILGIAVRDDADLLELVNTAMQEIERITNTASAQAEYQ